MVLHQYLYFYKKVNFKNSHLTSIKYNKKKYICIVKVYRVFPSNCKIFASSRKIQFHKANTGDSERVVIPIMQVRTYLTRNFATFRSSELQPPFTIEYKRVQKTSLFN